MGIKNMSKAKKSVEKSIVTDQFRRYGVFTSSASQTNNSCIRIGRDGCPELPVDLLNKPAHVDNALAKILFNFPYVYSAINKCADILMGDGLFLFNQSGEIVRGNATSKFIAIKDTVSSTGSTIDGVLKSMIVDTLIYGSAGAVIEDVRDENGEITGVCLHKIHPLSFIIISNKEKEGASTIENAINKKGVLGYFVNENSTNGYIRNVCSKDSSQFERLKADKDSYYVPASQFLHLKYDYSDEYGVSPFVYSQYNMELIKVYYERLINLLPNEGMGHWIFRADTAPFAQNPEALLNPDELKLGTPEQHRLISQRFTDATDKLMKTISTDPKNANSAMILDKNTIVEMQRVAREMDTLSIFQALENFAIRTVANAVSIDPSLLGLRDSSFASSMQHAKNNTLMGLKPLQNNVEVQVNYKLLPWVNLACNISKYTLKFSVPTSEQESDRIEYIHKLSLAVKNISGLTTQSGEGNSSTESVDADNTIQALLKKIQQLIN